MQLTSQSIQHFFLLSVSLLSIFILPGYSKSLSLISKSLQISWQILFTSQESLCPSVSPLHAGLFFNRMVVLLRGYQCILAPANLLCFMDVSVLYQCWSVFSLELLISFQKYIPYIQLGTLKKIPSFCWFMVPSGGRELLCRIN